MDPTAIAAAVIAILSPYLVKAGEEIAKSAGQTTWKKVAEMHQIIKTRFEKEGDDYYSQTLLRYEESPEKREATMQEVLEEILGKDIDFSLTLSALLKEAKDAGAGTVFNVQVSGGEVGEIINIDKLEGGLTINKSSKPRKRKRDKSSEEMVASENYSLLRKNLVAYFSVSELRTICFDLGLDHENLKSDTKEDLARELVTYCERRGKIADLEAVCKEQRPNVEKWV